MHYAHAQPSDVEAAPPGMWPQPFALPEGAFVHPDRWADHAAALFHDHGFCVDSETGAVESIVAG